MTSSAQKIPELSHLIKSRVLKMLSRCLYSKIKIIHFSALQLCFQPAERCNQLTRSDLKLLCHLTQSEYLFQFAAAENLHHPYAMIENQLAVQAITLWFLKISKFIKEAIWDHHESVIWIKSQTAVYSSRIKRYPLTDSWRPAVLHCAEISSFVLPPSTDTRLIHPWKPSCWK